MLSIEILIVVKVDFEASYFSRHQKRKKEGGKEPMDVDKKTRLEPFSFPDGTYNIFLENGFILFVRRLSCLFCLSPSVR